MDRRKNLDFALYNYEMNGKKERENEIT